MADYLKKEHDFVPVSFASSLKDATADIFHWERALLEGDTRESREWREQPDIWWSEKLGIQNFTPRYALQYIGTEVFRDHFHKDIWLLSLQRKIEANPDRNYVISDVRFRNEVKMLENMNGLAIRVKRGEDPSWFSVAQSAVNGNKSNEARMLFEFSDVHASEWDWAGVDPDYIINNDSTLINLYKNVDKVLIQEGVVDANVYS